MEFLTVKKKGNVGFIALNRPPANALSQAVLKELSDAFDEIGVDNDVKAVILYGEGRFFAAGADIKEFTSLKTRQAAETFAREGQQLFELIEAFPKPIIAAIHGAALGGGLELAMACHMRVAAEDAKLGLPELQLGIVPGFAGTQRLPRIVGPAKATEMILTSEPVTGKEAEQLGLVNIACPADELLERAEELANKIVQKSAVSVSYALELIHLSLREDLQTASVKEAELFGKAYESEDGQEGIQAFIEKRKPEFKDR